MRPTSPADLRDQLIAIFPEFRAEWYEDDNEFIEDGRFSYHGLMIAFSNYFSCHITEVSEQQRRALSDLFNEAVAEDDDLENAVATCFLEHMHQMRVAKSFWPFLSPLAKAKSHA